MRKFALPCTVLCVLASSFAGIACSKAPAAATSTVEPITAEDSAPLMSIDAMIARAKARDYWPDATHDWRTLPDADQQRLMSSDACTDFANFMFPADDADAKTAATLGTSVDKLTGEQQALRSDGVIVVKGGQIVWEHYVGPYAGHPERKHCMWSASKSFTTGLIGALAQLSERTKAGETVTDGVLTRSGQALGLSTPLSDLTDASKLNADPRLGNMTLEDFLSMNLPSPTWNEGYDGNIATSSVVKMLWVDGPKDMAMFAANNLFGPVGPPNAFRYSSGNAVVLMRALKDLYGADYDRMPFSALFDRLGMSSTVFERDQMGVYVGSSYAHMTLRDMARFGYAYLNGGYFGGEQVIHPDFVQKAREVGLGMRAPGTTDDTITEEGSFYSLGFWVNPNPQVLQQQGIKSFGPNFPQTVTDASKGTTANGLLPGQKLFPNSPVDVFFAAGHYGQNILIFPKDDLMVIRMSHDNEYFSKLDRMMSKARACNLAAAQDGNGG